MESPPFTPDRIENCSGFFGWNISCSKCTYPFLEYDEMWGFLFNKKEYLWWHPECWDNKIRESSLVGNSIFTTTTQGPEKYLADIQAEIFRSHKELNDRVTKAVKQYHLQRFVTALLALEQVRMLPHLHPIWHRINNQIRNLVGVRRTEAIIHPHDADYVRYLEHDWRYSFGTSKRPYPNQDTVGGPIRGFNSHTTPMFNGERIQVLSSQYRGHLGRTIGLDLTAEIMIELDNGVQLFASEMWWIHRHDHCLSICPVCNEKFFFEDSSPEIEVLQIALRAVREEMILCGAK